MGDRVRLSKYFPPDFDPSLIPRYNRPRDQRIRIMLPITVQCSSCAEVLHRGTNFNNAKKEIAQDINYLGINIYRFSFKCSSCSSQIVYRTDPEKADYALEDGA
eukprot:2775010-Rhodomonas_salina.3